jgi:hypothetical protein
MRGAEPPGKRRNSEAKIPNRCSIVWLSCYLASVTAGDDLLREGAYLSHEHSKNCSQTCNFD